MVSSTGLLSFPSLFYFESLRDMRSWHNRSFGVNIPGIAIVLQEVNEPVLSLESVDERNKIFLGFSASLSDEGVTFDNVWH